MMTHQIIGDTFGTDISLNVLQTVISNFYYYLQCSVVGISSISFDGWLCELKLSPWRSEGPYFGPSLIHN